MYNRPLFQLVTIFCLLALSCKQQGFDPNNARQEIIRADISMSDVAARDGFYAALYQYADTNFVKLSDGRNPVIGKSAFGDLVKRKPDTKFIQWKPVNADVAKSGELGYSWGNWIFKSSDTIMYGNYFTAWKKQQNGSWKMLLDGGNSTPAPQQ
jgi:ketosteroid isomerase-like protein